MRTPDKVILIQLQADVCLLIFCWRYLSQKAASFGDLSPLHTEIHVVDVHSFEVDLVYEG